MNVAKSWNEIRKDATAFARRWKDVTHLFNLYANTVNRGAS